MFTRDGSDPSVFDAVVAVEGKFTFRPDLDVAPTVEVTMVYLNSSTKTTYGSCPFKCFTPRTLEALRHFLECAEQDFGEVIFKQGMLTPFGPVVLGQGAESRDGLPKGLGEEEK
jgi:hypothetical protein